jgi:hypothetical protein
MGAKRSLAAFAQTCLVFSEPALDALWYELHGLLPLVRCMPCDLWKLESHSPRKALVHLLFSISCAVADAITKYFQRPIVPTDWGRFVYHAGRVREFIHRDPSAWDVLRTLNLGSTGSPVIFLQNYIVVTKQLILQFVLR